MENLIKCPRFLLVGHYSMRSSPAKLADCFVVSDSFNLTLATFVSACSFSGVELFFYSVRIFFIRIFLPLKSNSCSLFFHVLGISTDQCILSHFPSSTKL